MSNNDMKHFKYLLSLICFNAPVHIFYHTCVWMSIPNRRLQKFIQAYGREKKLLAFFFLINISIGVIKLINRKDLNCWTFCKENYYFCCTGSQLAMYFWYMFWSYEVFKHNYIIMIQKVTQDVNYRNETKYFNTL